MTTYVTYKDYIGIIATFTDEEIYEKYGRLLIKRVIDNERNRNNNNRYNYGSNNMGRY